MESNSKLKIKNFVLDVDGVLTDGTFHYTSDGKVMKVFGPNDADALLLLRSHLNICFVTGDKKGFEITKKRVETDMKFPLHLISTFERVKWLEENGFSPDETIYMGDGIFDAMVFDKVAYSIATKNSFYFTKERAHFVTPSCGGNSAVAEACLHIAEKFFEPIDLLNASLCGKGGEWGKII